MNRLPTFIYSILLLSTASAKPIQFGIFPFTLPSEQPASDKEGASKTTVDGDQSRQSDDNEIRRLLAEDEPAARIKMAMPFNDINIELNALIKYAEIIENCKTKLSKTTYILIADQMQNLINKLEVSFCNAELWDHMAKLYNKAGLPTKAILAAEQAILYNEAYPIPEHTQAMKEQYEKLKAAQTAVPASSRALIIGGGPSKFMNQAAIESNVHYVDNILFLNSIPHRILLTDGNQASPSVQCQRTNKMLYYRKPNLDQIDGPSTKEDINIELSLLAKHAKNETKTPTFIYFTGHGSPNEASNFENNRFDLWNNDSFSVENMSTAVRQFPNSANIIVVMAQCYSGSFANIIFNNGNRKKDLLDQNICGFFAGIAQREAAGCTPELNESYYHDFTCYFFAALSGMDRLGKPVSGVDYNHDGVVTMDEAFAYTLVNDESIDTPICTSDIFLRNFVPTPQEKCFNHTLDEIHRWASEAQLVAIEGLCKRLKVKTTDRLLNLYKKFKEQDISDRSVSATMLIRFINLVQSIVLAHDLSFISDQKIKDKYSKLIKLEHSNPLLQEPS